MPRVTRSAFRCPACGEPMRCLRTRLDAAGRPIRSRRCESCGHTLTTRETPIGADAAIGTISLSAILEKSTACSPPVTVAGEQ